MLTTRLGKPIVDGYLCPCRRTSSMLHLRKKNNSQNSTIPKVYWMTATNRSLCWMHTNVGIGRSASKWSTRVKFGSHEIASIVHIKSCQTWSHTGGLWRVIVMMILHREWRMDNWIFRWLLPLWYCPRMWNKHFTRSKLKSLHCGKSDLANEN